MISDGVLCWIVIDTIEVVGLMKISSITVSLVVIMYCGFRLLVCVFKLDCFMGF